MEHHWKELIPVDRYYVSCKTILQEFDRKIITLLYQPLIENGAYSLFMTLWAELEENRLWSEESTHHSLMGLMQCNLHEIFRQRLKLEGIGLLKTYEKKENDVRHFIYELQPPLSPDQFFNDGVLNVFLYNRVGKNKYAKLKRFFSDKQIDSIQYTPITKSFNEIFKSIHPSEMVSNANDEIIEQLLPQEGNNYINNAAKNEPTYLQETFNFNLFFAGLSESMVPKKAITDKVKDMITKLSFLYEIDPIEMQKITMSSLTMDDKIDIEKLRKEARDWYKFENGDRLPSIVEQVQPITQRTMNDQQVETKEDQLIKQLELISPKKVLMDLADGSVPSAADLQIIEDVMVNQKLLPGVVNVLIYYVLLRTDMKLTRGYVEKIASHWSRKNIKTVKQAMELAKQEHRQYQTWANSNNKKRSSTARKPVRKELLPDWFVEEKQDQVSEEKVEEVDFEMERQKLQERIKKYKGNSK
ncbi:replication initiation and membrane attachment family protein [Cytobacillus sp. IB215665]|uniref:replication initiation and membrane attachment family protein n=1 Tax=Cytobacillus sp. IB215665 TaxID=3097357 RepID=UPI002A116C5E|nr:replication initiation and membrane attachment family protein [Cytobacillus sp. IB215665]MDX8363969.1 replication initiation and membrane attachment family protein [Cytobacillus sp. IB215665]